MILGPTFLAFIILGILLIIAKYLRLKIKFFQSFFIPTSLIAGFLGLILTQNLPQKFISLFYLHPILKKELVSEDIHHVWAALAKISISLIFASLFLGKKNPSLKKIWKVSRPQIFFGQTIAWGQYVVGLLLTIFILVPLFNANELSGALIEISFQGGVGVAAGLKSTFNELGFSAAYDISIGLATFGILTGVIVGIIFVNIGVRKNKTLEAKKPNHLSNAEKQGIYTSEDQEVVAFTTRSYSIETLSIHLAFILLSVGIGALILQGLIFIENQLWADTGFYLMKYVPLFPLAMIGGLVTQAIIQKTSLKCLINRKIILHLQGLTLDFLIVASIASLSLTVISNHIFTFLILGISGLLWNVFCFIYLAPRIMNNFYFERGIVDFGQSMGMTTTGLLLLQIVDPEKNTPAFDGFGYKQLFFEPIVGGGLFTSTAVILIARFGTYTMLGVTGIIFLFWLITGLILNKKQI